MIFSYVRTISRFGISVLQRRVRYFIDRRLIYFRACINLLKVFEENLRLKFSIKNPQIFLLIDRRKSSFLANI